MAGKKILKLKTEKPGNDGRNIDEISFMGKSIADTYETKELRDHILDKPGMYIGNHHTSVEPIWYYNRENILIGELQFNEGIYKIFDEIISNASDQHVRINDKISKGFDLAPVKNIKVTFNKDIGEISVYNDGCGIDVAIHPEKKIYIPELIFGNLLSSGNYDKTEKRITTGQYGLGAKLTNIFSLRFKVETVDQSRKLLYVQEFSENMSIIGTPVITKYTKTPYTRITYLVDYSRFNIKPENIPVMDVWSVMERRVYDFSIYLDKSCSLYLNDVKIKCKSFEEYINLYIGSNKREVKRVFCNIGSWEICVCLSPSEEPMQISFVNGCFTDLGGKHVDELTKRLINRLIEGTKLKKDAVPIKAEHVKKYIWVFIKATIENPSFDTQSKRRLTSLYSTFGVKLEFPDDFIKKILDMDIMTKAQRLTEFKTGAALSKKTNGKKVKKIYDPKLLDCEYAGTSSSNRAVLILTEGDSAAGFFKEGRSSLTEEEQRCYAAFPMRGKPLNLMKASLAKAQANEEITKLKKLIGLVDGKKYTAESIAKELRYGRVMILADADLDGEHIKSLVFAFIYAGWPELINLSYLCSFPTPVIKLWKKLPSDEDPDPNKTISFYSEKEYEIWKETKPPGNYEHKYYKGLATHTQTEIRHCFKHKIITNYYYGKTAIEKQESKEALEMALGPKHEDDRKAWLIARNSAVYDELPYNVPTETLKTFIDYRLVKYCTADNVRSIPHTFDGLKPSQRKSLYAFMSNKSVQIKVAALSGLMMKDFAYHHGDMSSNETIIGLAQEYIGATNLPLMKAVGCFGTRGGESPGSDNGSARYIAVGNLNYSQILFNPLDFPLLAKVYDDGKKIEPEYFIPILPIVLLTGSEGIGTGWSTSICTYSVEDVVCNLKHLINHEKMYEMMPFFRGWQGTVIKTDKNKYLSIGKYTVTDENTILITEIPIGCKNAKSFPGYKKFLYGLAGFDTGDDKKDKKNKDAKDKASKKKDKDDDETNSKCDKLGEEVIEDIVINSELANEMHITVTFKAGYLETQLAENYNYEFEKKFKLAVPFSTTNMHLFDNEGIKKFNTAEEIISTFYPMRLKYYVLRKKYMLRELENEHKINNNRYRFVTEFMDGIIIIFKKNKSQTNKILEDGHYDKLNTKFEMDDEDEKAELSYEYLLSMPIWSFSEEKLESLRKQLLAIIEKIAALEATPIEKMWLNELAAFEESYKKDQERWLKNINLIEGAKPTKKLTMKPKTVRAKSAKA